MAELAERDRAPLSAAFMRAACSSARLPAEELVDAKLDKTPLEDLQAKEAEAKLQGSSGEPEDGKQVRQLQEQLSRQESESWTGSADQSIEGLCFPGNDTDGPNDPRFQMVLSQELQRLMAELEDANLSLAAKDEKLDSPSSRASFQISPSYWAPRLAVLETERAKSERECVKTGSCGSQETVELQALKEEPRSLLGNRARRDDPSSRVGRSSSKEMPRRFQLPFLWQS